MRATDSERPLALRQRLYVNIDHVATLRQARRAAEPDPLSAARLCEEAGADGITAHLREDRRHIQDADVDGIARGIRTVFNLEMACTAEMLDIAERLRPHQVTLVPEKREEITTEGGLDLGRERGRVSAGIARLRQAGIRTSLFIDPDERAVRRARELGAHAIEMHTGAYANQPDAAEPLRALERAATLAASLGLFVHAGHGLTTTNVGAVARIPEVEELNIGHHIVSRSVFVGLVAAVCEMRQAMDDARQSV
jgi:pyridoxine 5-phosphate synthase